MYYVLFNYIEEPRERDFEQLGSEAAVINFLHEKYKEIDVCQIIEVSGKYRLGLIVTEDFIKSTLNPLKEKEILRKNKKTLEELEAGEASAMSKIGADIEKEKEEELTEEEIRKKEKEALKKADGAIDAAKKELKDSRTAWLKCPVCKVRTMAPWNKTGKCSYCQIYKKKKKDDL